MQFPFAIEEFFHVFSRNNKVDSDGKASARRNEQIEVHFLTNGDRMDHGFQWQLGGRLVVQRCSR